MNQYGGILLGSLGACLSVFWSGIGSARGCGMVGEAASGIIAEEPEKFGKTLILQLLPGTQGLYGFVVGLMMIIMRISLNLTLVQGAYLLFAGAMCGGVEYFTALRQAEVCYAALQITVKNADHNSKGMIFGAVVETYAILGFVSAIILVLVAFPG